jgi:hypothetical protein
MFSPEGGHGSIQNSLTYPLGSSVEHLQAQNQASFSKWLAQTFGEAALGPRSSLLPSIYPQYPLITQKCNFFSSAEQNRNEGEPHLGLVPNHSNHHSGFDFKAVGWSQSNVSFDRFSMPHSFNVYQGFSHFDQNHLSNFSLNLMESLHERYEGPWNQTFIQ